MRTTITARHSTLSKDLKARAETVLARLARRTPRPTSVHVTFGATNLVASAEIVLNAARSAVFVASAEAPDHRTALDRALARLQRQLLKHPRRRPRRVTRKAVAR